MNTCKDCKHYSQNSCFNIKVIEWLGFVRHIPGIGPDGGCIFFEKKETPCCGNCLNMKTDNIGISYCSKIAGKAHLRFTESGGVECEIYSTNKTAKYWVCDYHEPINNKEQQ